MTARNLLSKFKAQTALLLLAQLLVTEVFALFYFGVVRGTTSLEDIEAALIAPVVLAFGHLYPIEYRGYLFGPFQVVFLNAFVLFVMMFSIVRNHKLLGCLCLLLYCLAGIWTVAIY
jgi:hypothetical protein